jgi:hypothetical protein
MIREDGTTANIADIFAGARDFTGTIAVLSENHWVGHKAALFNLSAKIELAANGTAWLIGTTTSTIHWVSATLSASEGGIETEFREDVIATGGTALVPVCRNRRTPKVTDFVVTGGATVTGAGELLEQIGFPIASSPQTRSTVGGGDDIEWVLDQNRVYGIKIFNLENRTKTIYGKFVFYQPNLLNT